MSADFSKRVSDTPQIQCTAFNKSLCLFPGAESVSWIATAASQGFGAGVGGTGIVTNSQTTNYDDSECGITKDSCGCGCGSPLMQGGDPRRSQNSKPAASVQQTRNVVHDMKFDPADMKSQ